MTSQKLQKNYGLDKPEYEITIKVQNEDNKGKSIHLLFGQKLEGKNQSTNKEGVFAAGDVCDPHYQQAIIAAGSGASAALDAHDYLNEIGK